ncbi:MAG: hypothetical protein ACFFAN_11510 [Promethearchaeota archaeon]
MNELIYGDEETFFGENINTSEEFIKDFSDRIDILYETAMEEEEEMPRLAYLITSLIVLKDRLNRLCERL